jgi:type II secretory ATPase GspE/PulE/Tfp pilus assembly ATPase PilB-like protein
MTLDEFDLTAAAALALREAIAQPSGLIAICAPVGCGKTTTRLALSREMEAAGRLVVNTSPANLQPDSFSPGSVVVLGETRHPPEFERAVELAAKALVLVEVRSGESRGFPRRLRDMGISPAATRRANPTIVTQRLLRRLCTRCRRAVPLSGEGTGLAPWELSLVGRADYEPVGCPDCKDGFRAKVAVFEVLRANAAAAWAPDEEFDHRASIRTDALIKVAAGLSTLSQVRTNVPLTAT